ncbi:3-oxoacyl-(acyl-carrier-protein) synthase 3 [Desulfamplus magnetovallimortis]|uniref:Beta-ketoacyl-[acyl-carrier-protein] synthase III n=1 Tax=Desulfamplus magnetovallimortis TaxID=1246637 RepID=A0A1W1HC76_9BACT|nr:beta-ketoacyl-ACP synthase III [Desulfamplus magnetovallimortis]SLM30101.1 3-oxoacyl-(acyl-carrier-protein) synthase 3 [Desulfamplus magnetovallimortis]
MKRAVIKGTGRAIPSRLVTNEDLTKIMDTSDEWIQQRTGIKQRYWIPEGETMGASDLGLEASHKALEKAGWKPEDIDLIIFATLSPDIFFPGSGCLLQTKLGLTSTPALDIRQQCTGFLYSLTTADAYIRSGLAEKILIVGAEVHSTGLDKTTRGRDVAVLFGDGAGAVCVEAVETDRMVGVLASALHADGKGAAGLMVELPASRLPDRIPLDLEGDDVARYYPVMNGSSVFKTAVRKLPQVTKEVLEKAEMELDDVDLIFPHQANLRINQAYQQFMKLDESRIFNNIQKYGNTTAASIPIALDEALEQNLVGKSGDTVLFVGFGAGFTWGGIVYRFM